MEYQPWHMSMTLCNDLEFASYWFNNIGFWGLGHQQWLQSPTFKLLPKFVIGGKNRFTKVTLLIQPWIFGTQLTEDVEKRHHSLEGGFASLISKRRTYVVVVDQGWRAIQMCNKFHRITYSWWCVRENSVCPMLKKSYYHQSTWRVSFAAVCFLCQKST